MVAGLAMLGVGMPKNKGACVREARGRTNERQLGLTDFLFYFCISLSLLDKPVSLLLIGLGGGGLPQFLRDFVPDAVIEVVELDPVVLGVAKEWFGFRPDDRLTVTLGDGLEHICTLEKKGR